MLPVIKWSLKVPLWVSGCLQQSCEKLDVWDGECFTEVSVSGLGHPLLMSPAQVHEPAISDEEWVSILCTIDDATGKMQNVSSLQTVFRAEAAPSFMVFLLVLDIFPEGIGFSDHCLPSLVIHLLSSSDWGCLEAYLKYDSDKGNLETHSGALAWILRSLVNLLVYFGIVCDLSVESSRVFNCN